MHGRGVGVTEVQGLCYLRPATCSDVVIAPRQQLITTTTDVTPKLVHFVRLQSLW